MKEAGSEYLQWVKTRRPGEFNLAASGILPCSAADVAPDPTEFEINGPVLYGFAPLQQAIADHCRVAAECVVGASGTSMANFLAMAALIGAGDEVLIEQPVYEPLLAVARYLGADVRRFRRDDNPADFISKRTRLIVVTNLHNPTCNALEERTLRELGHRARWAGARVLVDEVYLECMYENASSAFHYGTEFVSTASLTKAYGVGGLRCGWILAEPDLARRIWRLKDLIDPNGPYPAELWSLVAFRKLDALAARARKILETNRTLLEQFLRSCDDVEVRVPPHGTCVFPRVKKPAPERLFDLLHDRYDTDVVPGRFFETPDHFRLGLGVDSAILAEGLRRLRAALREL